MSSITLGELFDLPNKFNPATKEGSKKLEEYQFLLEQASQAALAFLDRDFAKFDPNIGDCACQIRTIKTILLARDPNLFAEMNALSATAKELQQLCADKLATKENKKNKAPIKQQADKEIAPEPKFSLTLSQNVAYLVQGYLFTLTHKMPDVKDEDPLLMCGTIDAPKLSRLSKDRMSNKKAEKISSIIRQNLSLASLTFIQQQANLSQNPVWINACSDDYTQRFNKIFYSVPMFYSYQILLETCRREAIPILFKVKLYAKDILTNGEPLATQYVRLNSQETSINTAFCIFEGVRRDSAKNLQAFQERCNNILDIAGEWVILAGAADHPQYAKAMTRNNVVKPIAKLEESIPETDQLQHYALRAKPTGCSIFNPSLFFIQHVYAQSEGPLLREGCPLSALEMNVPGVIDV